MRSLVCRKPGSIEASLVFSLRVFTSFHGKAQAKKMPEMTARRMNPIAITMMLAQVQEALF
jgi:hypothetical protein